MGGDVGSGRLRVDGGVWRVESGRLGVEGWVHFLICPTLYCLLSTLYPPHSTATAHSQHATPSNAVLGYNA
jgi:hypothetical protein